MELAKLLLHIDHEIDAFKMDISYKPKQLRGFEYPVEKSTQNLFIKPKKKQLLDIDRIKVAMRQSKKFNAKKHMKEELLKSK